MPNNQALQVFYGTVPLIGILLAVFWQNQTTLRDILERLRKIEEWMTKIERRLTTLEVRAGVIY